MSVKKTLLLSLILAAMTLPAQAGARAVIGRGDFTFYLDRAAFRGNDGRVIEEVSVRIPNNEIKFEKHDGQYRARLKFSVRIVDTSGKPMIEDAQEMAFYEHDEDHTTTSVFFQTVIKRYLLAPGAYDLSYAVEDLDARKVSVTDLIARRNKMSVVRGLRIELPEFPATVASFSDAMFVWEFDPGGDPSKHHPNPPRLYGLHKDTLQTYMELYLPDSLASAGTFEFASELVSAAGDSMRTTRLTLPNPRVVPGAAPVYPLMIREDLNAFPAGSYVHYLSFYIDGHRIGRTRAGRFSVAWDMRTWEVPRREYLAEARFLLDQEGFDRFQALPFGEQEQMLDKMWAKLDPAPETAENEAYEKFVSRLAFINEHYAEEDAGIFSARGLIYLRFGAPQEVVVDVIPFNRESLSEAIDAVENKYKPVTFVNASVKRYDPHTDRNVLIDPRGLAEERAGDHTAYPYELWLYDAMGDPILERDRIVEGDVGMRYLFIDRMGHGVYELESSSAAINK